MIIVQLKGGLGNQLFQYAAGYSLAKHHNVYVKVDVQHLKEPDEKIKTLRHYELQYLIVPPLIAAAAEIKKITKQSILQYYAQKLLPSYQRKIYNEKRFEFDTNFFSAGKDIYLKGYRQSEKYFFPVINNIKELFQFNNSIVKNVSDYKKHLYENESVAIHIRRGDYANADVQNIHGSPSPQYYQQAIDKIASQIGNPTFYIFSDDGDWVKSNLNFKQQAEFVSGNITSSAIEDFYLMSQCKHQIIANSTFSWWAAYLNPNPNKIVIAPKKWFNTSIYDTRDLIPEGWIKI